MSSFFQTIERRATARLLVALVLILAVVMVSVHALDVPWSLVHLERMTGGVSILDMKFHYSARAAQDLLTALGPDGRHFYLWRILGALDLFLPALMATVLSVAMVVAFRGLVAERSPWRVAQWLPLLAMALDYAENVLIATLLMTFPVEHPMLAAAAGWTTTAKTLAYMTCVAVCVVAAVTRLVRPRVATARRNQA